MSVLSGLPTVVLVFVAAGVWFFGPLLAIGCAVLWRAVYDWLIIRPRVNRRLAEDRQVAWLESIPVLGRDPHGSAW